MKYVIIGIDSTYLIGSKKYCELKLKDMQKDPKFKNSELEIQKDK